MLPSLAAGALAGLAVAMPIGAVGMYLLGLAARERFGVACAAALGVATVDGAYALVAAFGGAGLGPFLRRVDGPLRVLAALVLVAVSAHTIRTAMRRYRRPTGPALTPRLMGPGRAYLTLIALTAVNPATVITFAALVVGRSGSDGSLFWSLAPVFALGAGAASASWQLLLVGGGSVLGRILRGPRGQLGVSVVSAVVTLSLAAAVLVSRGEGY